MNKAQSITEPPAVDVADRPGWIPDHVKEEWDPSPYAYQTEERKSAAPERNSKPGCRRWKRH